MAKIEVIAERCKACGYCVKYCPKGCLGFGTEVNSKGYEFVESKNPDACIGCAICGRICPEGAIDVYM